MQSDTDYRLGLGPWLFPIYIQLMYGNTDNTNKKNQRVQNNIEKDLKTIWELNEKVITLIQAELYKPQVFQNPEAKKRVIQKINSGTIDLHHHQENLKKIIKNHRLFKGKL